MIYCTEGVENGVTGGFGKFHFFPSIEFLRTKMFLDFLITSEYFCCFQPSLHHYQLLNGGVPRLLSERRVDEKIISS